MRLRAILRIVAWIILIGGPIASLATFIPYLYARQMGAHGNAYGAWVGFGIMTTTQVVLTALHAFAIGGGLLVLLDIDARLRPRGNI